MSDSVWKDLYRSKCAHIDELKIELEKHQAFFREVAELTKEHDVLVDMDNEDHAVVYPRKLGAALEKVDPNWHGMNQ